MMNLSDVIITTDRLILKPVDFPYAEMIFKEFTPEITHYMVPVPGEDMSGVNNFITSAQKGLKANNSLHLVILDKSDETFLGGAGLSKTGTEDPELGIWIKKSAHGNKYGLEAITGLINWAKKNIDFKYLRYPVDKRNVASRRIAECNGGIIKRELKKVKQNGFELDEVEYWIYK